MLRKSLLLSVLVSLLAVTAGADERSADAHRVSVDPSLYEKPALTLVNPHADRVLQIEIDAWSSTVEARRALSLELEAGGRATVTLDGPVVFDRLAINADERFEASLESLATGRADDLVPGVVSRMGLFPCHGVWTLTCDWPGCSLGPFSAAGYVLNFNKVYWNLNTPTGTPWETENHQGLTANWTPDGSGCPYYVTNSLGDSYTVSIAPF